MNLKNGNISELRGIGEQVALGVFEGWGRGAARAVNYLIETFTTKLIRGRETPRQHLREYISANHPGLQGLYREIEAANSLAVMVMQTLRFVFGLGVEIWEAELAERAQADYEWGLYPPLVSKGTCSSKQLTAVARVCSSVSASFGDNEADVVVMAAFK